MNLVFHVISWPVQLPGNQYTLENEEINNSLDVLIIISFILPIFSARWGGKHKVPLCGQV